MLSPAPLFSNISQRIAAFALLLLLFGVNIFLEYRTYSKLFSKKRYFTTAIVKNQYQKGNKQILKLQTKEGFTFYTSSYEQLRDLRDRRVRLILFPKQKCASFIGFLRGFYLPATILAVLPKNSYYRAKEFIAKQHTTKTAKEIFAALFLATAIDYDVRQKLAAFGISHLVAISGFHIGLLLALITALLVFVLRPLWQWLVPHRNIYQIATLLGLVGGLAYLLFLGDIPSLVRAFVMAVVGFILYDRHIKLLSFETLVWVGLLVLALFPRFLFSYAFWLSIGGVYMIYLYFYHVGVQKGWRLFIGLNIWVFWFMLLPSITLFGEFAPTQLLSPLLSMLFVIFYPLALLLHLLGLGGSLDWMLRFLEYEPTRYTIHLPLWYLGGFLLCTLLSIYWRTCIWGAALSVAIALVYEIAQF